MSADARAAALRAAAPVAMMALIFYLSAQPDPGPDVGSAGRIAAHFAEYALLATLWAWALGPALGRRGLAAAAVIAFLYAVSDEIHQSYVPGRHSDPLDVLVDGLGIVAATAILAGRRRPG